MATSAFPSQRSFISAATTHAPTAAAAVPWYIWCGALAITSATIGGAWDVSWHRSIGRDSFWTPAHMAIYACGVLAAIVCGYLIFSTTLNRTSPQRAASVEVLGFRAPLGAFIAAWGGITMITSAPFDNWWHAAYGLDVKIVSPPHTLLILGIRAVAVGVLFLILAAMNRAGSAVAAEHEESIAFRRLQWILLYVGGLIVGGQMFFLIEYTWDVELHTSRAYIAMAIAMPVVFAMLSQASRHRWAATVSASIYSVVTIAEILILPLFPATPKLGPVYFQVTHMVPAKFPILIVVPAVALDLLWRRTRTWRPLNTALLSGLIFVVVLLAVEWPFASFLLSKAAENRFFGSMYFDYGTPADSYDRLRQFVPGNGAAAFVTGILSACIYAAASSWLGLRFGRWMRSVQR